MKTFNHTFTNNLELIEFIKNNSLENKEVFIQVFSWIIDKSLLENIIKTLNENIFKPIINWVTTAWEFIDGKSSQNSIVISFSCFEKTNINSIYYKIEENKESFDETLKNIIKYNTKLVLFFADWFKKSSKIEYFLKRFYELYPHIMIWWGRAWDNLEFKTSYIFNNDLITDNWIIITSFSSDDLIVNNWHNFDWIPIWKEFTITKAKNNIIYEIDNTNIIEIYKKYFWEEIAKELPWIWLEFPLIVNRDGINIARWAMQKVENWGLLLTWNIFEWEKVKLWFWNKWNILNGAKNNFKYFLNFPIESIFVYSCAARKLFLWKDIEQEISNLTQIAPNVWFNSYSEFYHNKTNIELLSYTTTYICLSEKNEINKNISFKEEKIDDKIMYALSNFISTTSQELTEINENLEKKVWDKVEQIDAQKNDYLEWYKKIIDNMTESIFILNKDREFIYINKKWIKTLGYNLQELKTKTLNDIFSSETLINYKKSLLSISPWEIPHTIWEIMNKNNAIIPIQISWIPYLDGWTVWVIKNLDEIKELKKLNHELLNKSTILHEYKKALDFTSYVVRINKNKKVQYLNQKVSDFFWEERSKNCIWKNYSDLINVAWTVYENRDLSKNIDLSDIYNIIDKNKTYYQCVIQETDKFGEIHWFQNYLIPILDISWEITEYISTSTDITQFIKYEKELNDSFEKLKELNEKKTDFLNIASHELRAPLTSINWYISMILDGDFGEINTNVWKYLNIVSDSLKWLLALISDMLDISRIESGKNECLIETFDLSNHIENITNELLWLAKNKNITINYISNSSNTNTKNCKQSTKKIITNILWNAIKYTPEWWNVEIILNDDKNNFIIECRDNWIWIEKKDMTKIFEKFWQAWTSLNKNTKWTWLWLYIVKELLDKLWGKIEVESQIWVWSTFRVFLPKK